jgi:hypothetical protein
VYLAIHYAQVQEEGGGRDLTRGSPKDRMTLAISESLRNPHLARSKACRWYVHAVRGTRMNGEALSPVFCCSVFSIFLIPLAVFPSIFLWHKEGEREGEKRECGG